MKIKERDLEWVRFAIKNRHVLNFAGKRLDPFPPASLDGKSGMEAFIIYDTHGKIVPTRHPNLLTALIVVKSSLNLHLKMWKEGIIDGTFTGYEIRSILISLGAPNWAIDVINKTVMDEWAKQTSI